MYFLPLIWPIHLLNLLVFMRMNRAYLIDDSDLTAFHYSAGPAATANWVHYGGSTGNLLTWYGPNGANSSLDSAPCHDGTYTFAGCRTTDICSVTIPFTGSGATVYGLLAGGRGINISVTVDDGPPEIHALAAKGGNNYNMALFDVQSLSSGTHAVTMTAIDWGGTYGALLLDYIDINQADTTAAAASITISTKSATTIATATGTTTVTGMAAVTMTGTVIGTVTGMVTVTTTGTTTGIATEKNTGTTEMTTGTTTVAKSWSAEAPMSTISNPTLHSANHTGLIVGGVIGGLTVFAAIALAIFCIKHRPIMIGRSARVKENYISQPFDPNYNVPTTEQSGTEQFSVASDSKMARPSNTNANILHLPTTVLPTAGTVNAPSGTISSIADSVAPTILPPLSSSSESLPATDRETQLTDEQADFVNNLHRHNIPASAIAHIMERMLNGGDAELETNMQVGDYDVAPPSYDHSRT